MIRVGLISVLLLNSNFVIAQSESEPLEIIAEDESSIELDASLMPPLPEELDVSTQSSSTEIPPDIIELPPELEEQVDIPEEPEPTIADLLTPNQPKPEPETVIALKARIKEIKAQAADYEANQGKRELRRELFDLRSEKIEIREKRLALKQDKLALKRYTVENKLSKTDLTDERRAELEARLEIIIAKEIVVDEKLDKLEKRSTKLEAKLTGVEEQFSLFAEEATEITVGEQPPL